MNGKQFFAPGKRWLAIVAISYSLLITVWLLLRYVFFDAYWPIAIVNTTAVYCFLPLALLLLPVTFSRNKLAITSLIIPVIAFFVFWGLLFFPSSAQEQTTPSMKIMSFNVLVSNTSTDMLTQSISTAAPDLIGLQEISPTTISALKSQLSDTYPYHTFDEFEPHGVGLMSKFPITAVTKFPFPPKELALHAVIDWDGQPIHVFVVHLSANNFFDNPLPMLPQLAIERYSQREYQVTRLREELVTIDEPVILLCDCNLTDTSEAYARLSLLLNDSFKRVGSGLGHTLHPVEFPFRVQRVDYVWYSDDLIPIDSYVGLNGGSDHHPVISTLIFKQDPQEVTP